MIELVYIIAYRFTNNTELKALYGATHGIGPQWPDRWIHGTWDAEQNYYPRVSYRHVASGGPREDNTSLYSIYTHRIRFQNWATDDEQAMWHQRTLERWFATEAITFNMPTDVVITGPPGSTGGGVVLKSNFYPTTTDARMIDKPKLIAQDLFEEPGAPDPTFGRIWQGVMDVEYKVKRFTQPNYPIYDPAVPPFVP